MLTVKRVAEILDVSPALVYALCAQGQIIHDRYGTGRGTIRISAEALAEFQARSRARPRMATPAPPRAVFRHLDPQRLAQAWRERGVELPSPPRR